MLEELSLYWQQSPITLIAIGICVLYGAALAVNAVLRAWLGREPGIELPFLGRIRLWAGNHLHQFALAFGVLSLAAMVAFASKPVRLLSEGTSAEAVVISLVESRLRDTPHEAERIRSTATIRFQAGDRAVEIERSTSRKPGAFCFAGCFRKGERLMVRYFADDPRVAEVDSFLGLFGGALAAALVAAFAFLIWWVAKPRAG